MTWFASSRRSALNLSLVPSVRLPAQIGQRGGKRGQRGVEFRLPRQFEGRELSGRASLVWTRWIDGRVFPSRGCVYDEAAPPAVAVWQAAPKNTTCTVNASNRTNSIACCRPVCRL